MSNRVWHKGAPPHVGWWNASINRSEDVWRWWNGSQWGLTTYPEDSQKEVIRCASSVTDHDSGEIEWSDYWPENARVPRIDPRKTK